MALNQMFAYQALRAQSIKASLLNADVAGAGLVLDEASNALKLNLTAAKGLEIVEDALGIKLDNVDTYGSLEMSADGLKLSNTIKGNRTFANDITVNGNLLVKGTTTTINSTVVDVADRLMDLNTIAWQAGDPDIALPAGYSGITVERGTDAGAYRDHAAMVWDEANSKFMAAMISHDAEAFVSYLDLEIKNLKAVDGTFSNDLGIARDAIVGRNFTVNGASRFNGNMELYDGKTFTLDAGAKITGVDTGDAAYQIGFAKQSADWAEGESPLSIGAAIDLLRTKIANTAAGASGDLVTYFDELRSDGVLGTAVTGTLADSVLSLFTGNRVAYVSGTRYQMAAQPFDASALADGNYKLYIDNTGAVKSGAAYADPCAKLGEISVAGGVVTAFVDAHRPLVALDEKVISVETKIDDFIRLIAGVNGAANVGVSGTISNALGLDGTAGKEKTVENALQSVLKLRMNKVRFVVDQALIDTQDGEGFVSLTISSHPISKDNVMVFVDGQMQDEGDAEFFVEVNATSIKVKAIDLEKTSKILVWVAPLGILG